MVENMVKKITKKKEENKSSNVVNVFGSRKRSKARATLKEGKGKIRINGHLLDNYKPDFARDKIMEPLMIAGDLANKVDISINVKGGGWRSQRDAVRLAISR